MLEELSRYLIDRRALVRVFTRETVLRHLPEAGRVRIAEEALATTAEALRVARAGGAQGTVSRFDILRAKVELANREAPLIQTRNARRHAELALNRICGLDPGTRVSLVDTLAALEGRRENAALAGEAYRLAAVRLENGLATPLERLDAELALTHSRVQLAESLHACNLARAAVTLAAGGDPEIITAALSASKPQKENQ